MSNQTVPPAPYATAYEWLISPDAANWRYNSSTPPYPNLYGEGIAYPPNRPRLAFSSLETEVRDYTREEFESTYFLTHWSIAELLLFLRVPGRAGRTQPAYLAWLLNQSQLVLYGGPSINTELPSLVRQYDEDCAEMVHFLTYRGDLAQLVQPDISGLRTTLENAYADLLRLHDHLDKSGFSEAPGQGPYSALLFPVFTFSPDFLPADFEFPPAEFVPGSTEDLPTVGERDPSAATPHRPVHGYPRGVSPMISEIATSGGPTGPSPASPSRASVALRCAPFKVLPQSIKATPQSTWSLMTFPSIEDFRLDEDSDAEGNVTLEDLRARSRQAASIVPSVPPRSPTQAPEDDGESNRDEPSRQRRRLNPEPSVAPTTRKLRPRSANPAPAKAVKKAPAKPKNKGKSVNRSSRMFTGGRPTIQQFANAGSVEPSEPDELADAIPANVQEPEAGQKRKRASSKAKSDNPKPLKGKAAAKAKEPTKPYSHPQPIRSGRGDAVTKKQYIPSAPAPDINVVGLLDVMSRPGPGRVIDSGCYSCISFNRECKPNGIMEKCGACTTQSDSHCGHSLTYYEHAARLNHAQPHSQLSNAALNSAIEQLTRASDTLAGMQAMFNEQRLLTMSAAHRLSSLVLAHYQFFGPVAVPDLHNVPEHLRETYNTFLLSNALELDLPYLDAEEVLRLEGAQFTPLPIEGSVRCDGQKNCWVTTFPRPPVIPLRLLILAVKVVPDSLVQWTTLRPKPIVPITLHIPGDTLLLRDPDSFPELPVYPNYTINRSAGVAYLNLGSHIDCSPCAIRGRQCTFPGWGSTCPECLVSYGHECDFSDRALFLVSVRSFRDSLFTSSGPNMPGLMRQFYTDLSYTFQLFDERANVDQGCYNTAMAHVLSAELKWTTFCLLGSLFVPQNTTIASSSALSLMRKCFNSTRSDYIPAIAERAELADVPHLCRNSYHQSAAIGGGAIGGRYGMITDFCSAIKLERERLKNKVLQEQQAHRAELEDARVAKEALESEVRASKEAARLAKEAAKKIKPKKKTRSSKVTVEDVDDEVSVVDEVDAQQAASASAVFNFIRDINTLCVGLDSFQLSSISSDNGSHRVTQSLDEDCTDRFTPRKYARRFESRVVAEEFSPPSARKRARASGRFAHEDSSEQIAGAEHRVFRDRFFSLQATFESLRLEESNVRSQLAYSTHSSVITLTIDSTFLTPSRILDDNTRGRTRQVQDMRLESEHPDRSRLAGLHAMPFRSLPWWSNPVPSLPA
ncbi:hypothetical protein DFH09DRAFT_1343554 [Mycena vulgaris]|nr:hypothetical protein DFH09DRAFT_1343554 [Mycena vulgaris]